MPTVCVKGSLLPDAGEGVFTDRDYAAEEIVCIYHGVDKKEADIAEAERDYAFTLPDGRYLVGHTQFETSCPLGVTQLINDAAKPDLSDTCLTSESLAQIGARILDAYDRSLKGRNVALMTQTSGRKHICVALAVRSLRAGEELYTAYGLNYWSNWYSRRLPSTSVGCARLGKVRDAISYALSSHGHPLPWPDLRRLVEETLDSLSLFEAIDGERERRLSQLSPTTRRRMVETRDLVVSRMPTNG